MKSQPSTWGYDLPGTFRTKVVEIHDNVATMKYWAEVDVFHIENPNAVKYPNAQEFNRMFLMKQDGNSAVVLAKPVSTPLMLCV